MIVIPHFLTATHKSGRGCNRAMNLLVSFFINLFFLFLCFWSSSLTMNIGVTVINACAFNLMLHL